MGGRKRKSMGWYRVCVSLCEHDIPDCPADPEVIENVVRRAQKGDHDAVEEVLHSMQSVVRLKARSLFMAGAENEDLLQEGMIGLYKAIRDFRFERQIPFRAFAEICVQRQLITAIKTAMRLKHQPLNSYLSLHKPISDGEIDRTLMETIPNQELDDPEQLVILREQKGELYEQLAHLLSSFEYRVLALYVEHVSYREIACATGTTLKAIDNALCRIKRKLTVFYAERRISSHHASS